MYILRTYTGSRVRFVDSADAERTHAILVDPTKSALAVGKHFQYISLSIFSVTSPRAVILIAITTAVLESEASESCRYTILPYNINLRSNYINI
jgi:hypothetical protein